MEITCLPLALPKKIKTDGAIQHGLKTMAHREKEHMEKLFRAAYYLVKSNRPFKKFPLLLELEELEGLKFLDSYKNDKSVREFIMSIAEELNGENLEKISRCNFFSLLCDGSTDSSITEKELMYILFLDPDTHEIKLVFFSLKSALTQTADGLMETFLQAFDEKQISARSKKTPLFCF